MFDNLEAQARMAHIFLSSIRSLKDCLSLCPPFLLYNRIFNVTIIYNSMKYRSIKKLKITTKISLHNNIIERIIR